MRHYKSNRLDSLRTPQRHFVTELRGEHIRDKLFVAVLHAHVRAHEPAGRAGPGQSWTQARSDNRNDSYNCWDVAQKHDQLWLHICGRWADYYSNGAAIHI